MLRTSPPTFLSVTTSPPYTWHFFSSVVKKGSCDVIVWLLLKLELLDNFYEINCSYLKSSKHIFLRFIVQSYLFKSHIKKNTKKKHFNEILVKHILIHIFIRLKLNFVAHKDFYPILVVRNITIQQLLCNNFEKNLIFAKKCVK